jgi:hypothetical protein
MGIGKKIGTAIPLALPSNPNPESLIPAFNLRYRGSSPAMRKSDIDRIAGSKLSGIAHNGAAFASYDAVAAIEHVLRAEVMQIRSEALQRATHRFIAARGGDRQSPRQLTASRVDQLHVRTGGGKPPAQVPRFALVVMQQPRRTGTQAAGQFAQACELAHDAFAGVNHAP